MPKETGKPERRHTKETPESLADTREMLTPKEQAKQDIREKVDQYIDASKKQKELREQLNALDAATGYARVIDMSNLKEQSDQETKKHEQLESKLSEMTELLDGMMDDLATTMKEKQDILGAEDLSDVTGQVLEMEERGGKMFNDMTKVRVYAEAIDHARKQEE